MVTVRGFTCSNCGFFVPAGFPHCCQQEAEAMESECSEVFESIHEELIEIAEAAADLIQLEDAPDDQHNVRSAIYQTLIEKKLAPPRIMAELEKHTYRRLAERRGN